MEFMTAKRYVVIRGVVRCAYVHVLFPFCNFPLHFRAPRNCRNAPTRCLSHIFLTPSLHPPPCWTCHSEMQVPQVPIWTTDGPVDMALQGVEVDGPTKTTPFERRFNPYDFNGGYVLLAMPCGL